MNCTTGVMKNLARAERALREARELLEDSPSDCDETHPGPVYDDEAYQNILNYLFLHDDNDHKPYTVDDLRLKMVVADKMAGGSTPVTVVVNDQRYTVDKIVATDDSVNMYCREQSTV